MFGNTAYAGVLIFCIIAAKPWIVRCCVSLYVTASYRQSQWAGRGLDQEMRLLARMNRGKQKFSVGSAAFIGAMLLVVVLLLGSGNAFGQASQPSAGQVPIAFQPSTIPNGWRLTKSGWEHTSSWNLGTGNINQLIAAQRNREPAWVRWGFSRLRSIPPLMIAVLQITAIAVILNTAEHRKRQEAAKTTIE